MKAKKKRKKFEEFNQAERITFYKKKLDEVWSWLVRDRDGRCRVCKRPRSETTLFAHHWFLPKTYSLPLRWNLYNGIAVCYGCHRFKIHLFATYCYLGHVFERLVEDKWDQRLRLESAKPKLALKDGALENWLSGKLLKLNELKARREKYNGEMDEYL